MGQEGEGREGLIHELAALHGRMARLEKLESRHRHADEALRESEEKFRLLFEKATDPILLLDGEKFVDCNEAAVRLMRASSKEQILGLKLADLSPERQPDGRLSSDKGEEMTAATFRDGVNHFEWVRRALDGTEVWIDVSHTVIPIHGTRLIYAVWKDIGERKRTEEKLRESEEQYRTVFETTGAATAIIETDGTVSLCNAEFERLSGYTRAEIEGVRRFSDFLPHDDAARMEREDAAGREAPAGSLRRLEIRFIPRSGEVRNVYVVMDAIRGTGRRVASIIDITNRRRMEEELARARNLESIGTLAGGIAHDFNNLLMAVAGYISVARLHVPGESEAFSLLKEAERITLSGKELTEKLITFSKGGAPLRKVLNLTRLIADTCSVALVGSNARCEYEPADDLLPVEADESQLRQVIHNLLQNAREAMPRGGPIKLRAANVTVDSADHIPLAPGRYVKVTIEDQGMGIKEDDLPKIFDPYFTSKGMGSTKGMGLGLAVAYSIVKRHNGHIMVESSPDKGTAVTIYLPAFAAAEVPDRVKPPGPASKTRVIFMDDDDNVRNIGSQVITHLGYDVALARDGNEAVAVYRQALDKGNPFDVVILDLTVKGGMGGAEAMRILLSVDPGIRAIVSSGYTDDPVISDYEGYGFKGAITKPYKIEDLHEILLRIVGGPLKGS